MIAMCQTRVTTRFQEAESGVLEAGFLGLLESKH